MLSRGGRNSGIRASSGKYVMFVDSDDWVAPDYVETLYLSAEENKADIVTADYFEYKDGQLTEISLLGKNIETSTDSIKELILQKGCRLVTSIFKKHLFFDNNLFFPEGLLYEDNAIGPALFLSANKIIKVDFNCYYYRVDNLSTTRSFNNYNFFDRLKTSVIMLENARRVDANGYFKKLIDDRFIQLS